MGQGPMTGRAAGYCAGYGVPGYMNPVPGRWFGSAAPYAPAAYPAVPYGFRQGLFGRGLGLRRGMGFGRGRGFGPGRGRRWFGW